MNTSLKEMNEIFDNIIMVNEQQKPTKEQIAECMEFYNGSVAGQNPEDWYCLLRNAQGDLNAYKNGLKYMIDSNDFIKDSLFCEYGYIINLDQNILEFWVGFQTKPELLNRYGTAIRDSKSKYYPCKMISYYPLDPEYMKEHTVWDYIEDMNDK